MKILVTGGRGMVGQALRRIMPEATYVDSGMYDLRFASHVRDMFSTHKPETVVHLAATVGGILDNIKRPVDYFQDNILMNTNVIRFATRLGVSNFIGMLSTCIYPDQMLSNFYPLIESLIHFGPPTPTNFEYAYAKRAMAVHIDSLKKENHELNYSYLIPCNIYGPGDKFGERSHFMGALIEKIYNAINDGSGSIDLFGTGKPLRQFIYVDDVAEIIAECIKSGVYKNMNVCPDNIYSIADIASTAVAVCDRNGSITQINYDDSKPDGQFNKSASNALLKSVFPEIKFTKIEHGIERTWGWYVKNKKS